MVVPVCEVQQTESSFLKARAPSPVIALSLTAPPLDEFKIKAPSTCIRIFQNPEPFFFPDKVSVKTHPDIVFESDDAAKLAPGPVSYRALNQYVGTRYRPSFSMANALKTFYCRGVLSTRVNSDSISCVWTGEFDLNMLTCGRRNF